MHERSEFTGLVVEDEWLLRLELVEELTRAGWHVREAASGEEALLLLEKEGPFAFLITDIRLSDVVNGWQVAEAARAVKPEMPVIYVSANPIHDDRRVPGSVFLGKPCDIGLLLAACDRMVRG